MKNVINIKNFWEIFEKQYRKRFFFFYEEDIELENIKWLFNEMFSIFDDSKKSLNQLYEEFKSCIENNDDLYNGYVRRETQEFFVRLYEKYYE